MASYGSVEGVAALTYRYTSAGAFDVTTNPTSATVTGWLAQISSMLNVTLATAGFSVPVTDPDATPALDGFVNALAADLTHAANATGRFYSERMIENGVSPIRVISNDIQAWVQANAAGLVAMGANRVTSKAGQIAYRNGDEAGNVVEPLFQRDTFGRWSANQSD